MIERPRRLRLAAASRLLLIPLLASACSRLPQLAHGPIEVRTAPTVVRFEHAVAVTSPKFELCFEFERPGDSQHARGMQIALLDAAGGRHEFGDPEWDRRGDSLVAITGRVPRDPGSGVSAGAVLWIEAAELTAPVELRLRGLRGGCRAER